MAHVRFHERKWVHTRLSEKDRTQRLTRRNRGLPDGAAITTLGAFHTVRKPCVARGQNGVLCRFWALAEGAPEERRKPSEQRCAYARRCSAGVAAPLGCVFFCFCRNCGLYALHSELSVRAKQGWYHYTRRALHAAEMPDGRLSKRFICRFLASPIYICESSRRALPISASIQIACCWISRGHIACPWLIQA